MSTLANRSTVLFKQSADCTTERLVFDIRRNYVNLGGWGSKAISSGVPIKPWGGVGAAIIGGLAEQNIAPTYLLLLLCHLILV